MTTFRISLLAAAVMVAGVAHAADVSTISGAGATFPYPIYSKWAEAYNKATGVKLNYQSIGSGGGVKQIVAGTVDFGASDDALKPEKLEEAGLTQFPAVMGAVVPVVNLAGIGPNAMKLDQATLADIYLGNITKWNDPKIVALNPGLTIPEKLVTVVRRSDGSGTTAVFTNYLAKISATWAEKVGEGKAVNWPVGMGGKGNEGVASYVKQIDGAIGYVEYAYAKQNKLSTVMMKNKSGNYVIANAESTMAAAASADWKGATDFYLWLTDAPGADAWPIANQTNILVYKEPKNCAQTEAVLKFFDWSWKNGQKMAQELDYVPLPKELVTQIEEAMKSDIKCDGVAAAFK